MGMGVRFPSSPFHFYKIEVHHLSKLIYCTYTNYNMVRTSWKSSIHLKKEKKKQKNKKKKKTNIKWDSGTTISNIPYFL